MTFQNFKFSPKKSSPTSSNQFPSEEFIFWHFETKKSSECRIRRLHHQWQELFILEKMSRLHYTASFIILWFGGNSKILWKKEYFSGSGSWLQLVSHSVQSVVRFGSSVQWRDWEVGFKGRNDANALRRTVPKTELKYHVLIFPGMECARPLFWGRGLKFLKFSGLQQPRSARLGGKF